MKEGEKKSQDKIYFLSNLIKKMKNKICVIILGILAIVRDVDSLPVDKDAIVITSEITEINAALVYLIEKLAPTLEKKTIKTIGVKNIDILGTKLNFTLTDLNFNEIDVTHGPENGFHPLDVLTSDLHLPPLTMKGTSKFEVDILEKKETVPKTYKGTTTILFDQLAIYMRLKSVSNGEDQINFQVQKKSAKFNKISIHFSDPEFDKTWQRLFGNKITQELIFSTVILPKLKKAIEEKNFGDLFSLNLFTFAIQLGINDLIKYPKFRGLPESNPLGFQAQFYLNLTVLKDGKLVEAPDLLNPDMTQEVNDYTYSTISVNNDLINKFMWFLMESGIIAIEINQSKAPAAFPFKLDTPGISLLFPNIQQMYPGNNSVIIQTTFPSYAKDLANFRAHQGRYAIKLSVNLDFWVYDGYNPAITTDVCGALCTKAVSSQIELYLTLGLGFTDTPSIKELSFSSLSLEIGNVDFKSSTFKIDKENFMGLVNGLVDGLVPSRIGGINLEKVLDVYEMSFDIKPDQRSFLEVGVKSQGKKKQEKK